MTVSDNSTKGACYVSSEEARRLLTALCSASPGYLSVIPNSFVKYSSFSSDNKEFCPKSLQERVAAMQSMTISQDMEVVIRYVFKTIQAKLQTCKSVIKNKATVNVV